MFAADESLVLSCLINLITWIYNFNQEIKSPRVAQVHSPARQTETDSSTEVYKVNRQDKTGRSEQLFALVTPGSLLRSDFRATSGEVTLG